MFELTSRPQHKPASFFWKFIHDENTFGVIINNPGLILFRKNPGSKHKQLIVNPVVR